jgi:SH3 domain-containing YSC84-like protein 1
MSTYRLVLSAIACWILGVLSTGPAMGQGYRDAKSESPISSEAGVVNEAAIVLQELSTANIDRIPARLIAESHAIAIFPHFIRGAFVVGICGGRGVLITRDPAGRWQAPEFMTMGGGSFGWQIGVQATDLVLIFRTPRSLANMRKGKITLGADASAAAGPVGRYASVATDSRFQAEILTYSRSRGLFAGVSLSGAVLQLDIPATQRFYQLVPGGTGVVPAPAQALVYELMRLGLPEPQYLNNQAFTSTPPVGQIEPSAVGVHPQVVQLSQVVSALQARVDDPWQQYLALPPDWISGKPLNLLDVNSVLIRYERVETNPQFSALRSQPEFQEALKQLRTLASHAGPNSTPLSLPPPPPSP